LAPTVGIDASKQSDYTETQITNVSHHNLKKKTMGIMIVPSCSFGNFREGTEVGFF
jgi:hypothetical protein